MSGAIKTNLNKALTGYGFFLCIAFTVILCFSAHIYNDQANNDQYSVFMALRSFDREHMLTDCSFSSIYAIIKGAEGWLTMFIPIIAAFAFIPLVCDEYEARSVRLEIFRVSKVKYHTARFVTACLTGGLAVMMGYAVYCALMFALLPSLGEYGAAEKEMFFMMQRSIYPELEAGRNFTVIAEKLLTVFFYGAMNAVPAITITSFIRNKYLVMCIPFFLKYAIGQMCVKVQSQAVADFENMDISILNAASVINPDSLVYICQMGGQKTAVVIYNLSLMGVMFAVYLIIQLRRRDAGE